MRITSEHFAMLLAGGLVVNGFSARANFEVSAGVNIQAAGDFTGPLAAEGAWVTVGSYGRCWRPNGVPVGWRPYCSGQWVWTDCGWYWQSDEPWAWACYHYGNWVYDAAIGWAWVPGIEWAPAWVSWRTGPGYIGWAPLGPRGVVYAGPQFVFVENSRFGGAIRPNDVIVNNITVISKTKVINNIKQQTRVVAGTKRTVMVNEGPGLAAVQKASGKSFKSVPIQEAAQHARVPAEVTHQIVATRPSVAAPHGEIRENEPRMAIPKTQPNVTRAPNVVQEPKQNPPATTWHQPRPGDNREPTTRFWTPQPPRPGAPAPNAVPDKKVSPQVVPREPEKAGPAPKEPEHTEGHDPK